jgi:hypothetical protein
MGLKKQEPFPPPKTLDRKRLRSRLEGKLHGTKDLEHAVLMAHVLIYEELCRVLGVRLRTDSMPERMPTFESVAALALAGTAFEQDREAVGLLNGARNEVAHRTDRKKFEASVRQFSQRMWDDPAYGLPGFSWSTREEKQVKTFWLSFITLSVKLDDVVEQFRTT